MAALAGAYASYRALIPSDCAAARESLLKADELGSDQAAFLLAQLAANQTCGDVDKTELERWLKKAVTLDYPGAAVDLMNLYGEGDQPDGVGGAEGADGVDVVAERHRYDLAVRLVERQARHLVVRDAVEHGVLVASLGDALAHRERPVVEQRRARVAAAAEQLPV